MIGAFLGASVLAVLTDGFAVLGISAYPLEIYWLLLICDRINLLQHGAITVDKPSAQTSVAELNEIVIAEYRRALEERQR